MSRLALDKLTHAYFESGARLVALRDVSLRIEPGEFVTLIGPSGCGKSTLLQIIAGLQRPDQGLISIDGGAVGGKAGQVAYMPQEDALLPWRSVLGNILLGPEISGKNLKAARQRALELLPLFGLDGFADAFPAQLSGGMRQRAALLRTFLIGSDLVLLDEPLGALDALTRRQLQGWLLEVWQHFDYTILFVTHDISEAALLSDRILVMSARPGTIATEIRVPLPRPRIASELAFSPEMMALEAQLLKLLQDLSSER